MSFDRQVGAPRDCASFVDVLRWRASRAPDAPAFVFLRDGELDEERVTYGELDRRARRIGAALRSKASPGDRVVLMYPPGLDFVAAFFGCLYGGLVAVPVYPPTPARLQVTLPRLQSIVADAGAETVATVSQLLPVASAFSAMAPDLARRRWVGTDSVAPGTEDGWDDPHVEAGALAFLQYTSGSTGAPKGVMVSHGNLLVNAETCCVASAHDASRPYLAWLPLYHDMGLIGGVLCPVWYGALSVLMSPFHFLQRPARWLEAISRYGAASSPGPNFAYELCATRVSAEERKGLDLSTWAWAPNAAEPIRASTLDRFAEAFQGCGFRREAFYPAYGLAEATLLVSGGEIAAPPVVVELDARALARGRVEAAVPGEPGRRLVGCGAPRPGVEVVIVDPERGVPCVPDEIGEIWVTGPSVAGGYWGKPDFTAEVFRARLPGRDATFLRTGDLGFVRGGELFIAARRKDLIIIRGANYYPQDIELAAESSHPALRRGCSAAFSVDVDGEERLVVVAEMASPPKSEKADPAGPPDACDEVVGGIRSRVTSDIGVAPHAVLLLQKGTVPKTSSGKIQRHACKQGYLASTLDVVGGGVLPSAPEALPPVEVATVEPAAAGARVVSPPADGPGPLSSAEIERWIVAWIAARLRIAASAVRRDLPLVDLGLDSLGAAELGAALEAKLGRKVPATIAWSSVIVAGIAEKLGADAPAPAPPAPRDVRRAEPIAVIGLACRFPGGASSPGDLWQMLLGGVDAVSEVPADRWDVGRFYDPDPGTPGKMSSRWGGFVRGVDQFDPELFGISPREAESMDPQQRLLLEVTWEALEDAGIVPGRLARERVGVFVGMSSSDYSLRVFGSGRYDRILAHSATGCSNSVAAGRLSYVLGVRGPSVVTDTACSSSLVAVHQACKSLQSGEARLAIAAGVNLVLSPETSIALSQMRALSPTGRCRTFDARADGYVRGEGCGVVVLKPLSDALADGDDVWAVIRGSAVNHDGRSNGLTAPNGDAQEEVLRLALADAEVDPGDVDFVETHGTGTPLGDPIEVGALGAVYGSARPEGRPLFLGALKSNVGHLEAAAGVAALIKTALVLRHRAIPRNLHFEVPNPVVDWGALPVRVPVETIPWNDRGRPRRAGVSAFGISGTNVHVVLEEAPVSAANSGRSPTPPREAGPMLLSARTEAALREQATRLADLLQSDAVLDARDLCASLATTRTHHPVRMALSLPDDRPVASCVERLRAFGAGADVSPEVITPLPGRLRGTVAFLFTGQGAQLPGMGRRLHDEWPAFREAFDACAALFEAQMLLPLRRSMWAAAGSPEAAPLDETAVTQPALFAFEYALASAWRAWGVRPDVVLGHSIGEIVAACVAGVFSLEDAVRLVAARGRLMQALPSGGAMLAVELSEADARALVARRGSGLALAAVNGPSSVVVSGAEEAVEGVGRELAGSDVRVKRLRVSHPFHSAWMDPMLGDLLRVAESITYREPSTTLMSNVSGGAALSGEVTRPPYWVRHVRETVRFADDVRGAFDAGARTFVEIGPAATLLGLVPGIVPAGDVTLVPSSRRGLDEVKGAFEALARVWVAGHEVDWRGVFGRPARRVKLPTYAWQHARYWVGEEAAPPPEPPREVTRASAGLESLASKRAALLAASPIDRARMVHDSVRGAIARVLRAPVERVDVHATLRDMGMDSLMAFEVRRRVEQDTAVKLTMGAFTRTPTISGLAEFVLSQLEVARSHEGPLQTSPRGDGPRPTVVSFSSADGMTIYGHLSLPAAEGPFPVVVVHAPDTGGALDDAGRYAHLGEHAPLVAAGFGVLTVDPRGARGHGPAYAAKGELGGRDVDDVVAATRFLMARPDVDARRLFVMGTSRGAYVALLAAEAADLWRGIVLNMGYYDPLAYARHEASIRPDDSPLRDVVASRDWAAVSAWFDDPARQPIARLATVRAPILAIHGEDDRTVPVAQAELLARAAAACGVTLSLEKVAGMGHDIQFERDDLWPAIWQRIVAFLERASA